MKVEKDEFYGGKSAMMTMRRQTVPDWSCRNWKGTAANSGQFDGRRD